MKSAYGNRFFCIRSGGKISLLCTLSGGNADNNGWIKATVINGAWDFKIKGNQVCDWAPSSAIPLNIREVEVIYHPKLFHMKGDYNDVINWMEDKGQYHSNFRKSLYKFYYQHIMSWKRIKYAYRQYKSYGTPKQYIEEIPF